MITGMTKSSNNHGFNLLEMSIVLMILGAIAGGFIQLLASNKNENKRQITIERMETVIAALEDYAGGNNHLPCPSPNVAFNADDGGAPPNPTFAVGDGSNEGGGFSCVVATGGLTTLIQQAADSGALIAYPGTVPVHKLGLPPIYTLDGWGRRFTYVVANEQVNTGSSSSSGTFLGDDRSCIEILDANDNSLIGDPVIYDWDEGIAAATDPDDQFATATTADDVDLETQTAAFILISHGANGAGAMEANSTNIRATSGNTEEDENAYDESTPMDCLFYKIPESDTFDDIVMWRTKKQLKGRGP